MFKKDCFLIGSIFKLHGYKGNFVIYNENNYSFTSNKIEYLFIEIDHILVPFFIEKFSINKTKNILIKLEDINSETKAKKFLNLKVYLPNKYLLIDKEKTIKNDINGFIVNDINLGFLGTIKNIDTQTSQKLIYVSNEEKEFCFPMNDHFIKSIKFETRTIFVEIPKEIIELN